jgi:NADH-quinone oxidoreductase subunit K
MLQTPDFLATITVSHYLVLAALLFIIGMAGVLLKKNVLVMLMSIELMLNAVNLVFIAFSKYNQSTSGHIIVFFVMTIAAAEAAVGLAIVVSIFKRFKEVNIRFFEHLKG